ncbi:MAG: undecaprenyldiphospho-muramoylpentapeptide beta-N-acetylglucosaminyltransferase [Legionellales bacterium]|nr:undecaprenyldiphospho-muramoylpentapeptide beta-N-acetylglucosaminyltransferase [Legionellales bacterium]
MRTQNRPIILAAGGTGGHVYPALALAETLRRRGWKIAVVTDDRGTAFNDQKIITEIHHVRAASLAGGTSAKVKGLMQLIIGLLQARALLKKLKPIAAVGFGGYPSVPTMCAATQVGIPTVIHEQNAILGRANRLLASRVRTIATSFDRVSGIAPNSSLKVVLTGNPVRESISAIGETSYPELGLTSKLNVLIFGGSQGARVLSEIVPKALLALPDGQRSRLAVSQQCRPEDLERVRAIYEGGGIQTTLKTYFPNMDEQLSAAHLVISRAGASTISELIAAKRPAMLVPYPNATDDHQTANANAIAACGSSWCVPEPLFTIEKVSEHISTFMKNPALLVDAANSAGFMRKPDAAKHLADAVEANVLELTSHGAAA